MSLFDRIANAIAPAYGHAQSSAYWLVVVAVGAAAIAGLLYGRRFFWIFAGLLGFVVGQYVSDFLVAPLPLVDSLFELAIGVAFGLLAIAYPWPVATVLVFAGAGAAAGDLFQLSNTNRILYWMVALLAGSLGLLALRSAYSETLIVLTAVYSALMLAFVLRELAPSVPFWQTAVAMALLVVVGLIKQGMDLRRERREPYLVPASAGGVAPENLP